LNTVLNDQRFAGLIEQQTIDGSAAYTAGSRQERRRYRSPRHLVASDNGTNAATPEPAPAILFAAGLAALACLLRRSKAA